MLILIKKKEKIQVKLRPQKVTKNQKKMLKGGTSSSIIMEDYIDG
ncbi:MAG: hypothetical protein AB8H03_17270 [Saprospiraceae bacterium]